MTQEEVIKVLSILKASYPTFYKDMNKDDAKNTINVWSMMFYDDDYRIVSEAIKALIVTLKFPPSIADVKEKIQLITQPQQMTEIEAWNLVKRSISYYDNIDNFNTLPKLLQRLVGSPSQLKEWALMPTEQINTVVASNFQRSYKVRIQHEYQMQALPNSTKELINTIGENLKMIER